MRERWRRSPAEQLQSVTGPHRWTARTRGGWGELARRVGMARAETVWAVIKSAVGVGGRDDGVGAPGAAQGDRTARSAKLARLEAVLFAADEPLSSRRLAQASGVGDGIEVRRLVRQLNTVYEQGGSAVRVAEIAGGFQLLTKAEFGRWLERWQREEGEKRLSAPALETLAVVAYRQPVLRADVEAIRGVQCGEMLRQLMERGLVRIAGRHHTLGRPILYGTTKKFLQVFGMKNLGELPMVEELRLAAGGVGGGLSVVDSSELHESSSPKPAGEFGSRVSRGRGTGA